MSTTDDLVAITARIKPESAAQLDDLRHWVNVNAEQTVLNSDSQLIGWLIDRALLDMRAEQEGAL